MRQRWFGDRGLRVPELAAVCGVIDRIHAAVRRALSRPEVAAVLVPVGSETLLELDLTGLTYG